MSKQGYIKLHRQIQSCDIWTGEESFDRRSAWVDLLLLANHADKKTVFDGKAVDVKRGQRLTSIRSLAERWHWSNDKTLRFLNLLQDLEMIRKESNARRTLITIENYDKFQSMDDEDRTLTERSPNADRTLTERNNNDKRMIKNEKEYIKHFKAPSLEEIIAYCSERSNSVDPNTFFDYYESVGWKIGNRPMKDWKATVRNWERRNGDKRQPEEEDYGTRLMREAYEELRNERNNNTPGRNTA